jgi:sarcosine oxidase delta subunit
MGYIICPECNSKKVRVYSCCTGDHVDSDIMVCPVCKEHLGEENCFTCKGEGRIQQENNNSEAHLKCLELLSEFSVEKSHDICDAMLMVAEQCNDLKEATFWISVKKEIDEYPFIKEKL